MEMKTLPDNFSVKKRMYQVVLRGFEPRQAEPKTAVLPLHHKTITCSQGRSPQPRDKVTHKIAHDQIFPRF